MTNPQNYQAIAIDNIVASIDHPRDPSTGACEWHGTHDWSLTAQDYSNNRLDVHSREVISNFWNYGIRGDLDILVGAKTAAGISTIPELPSNNSVSRVSLRDKHIVAYDIISYLIDTD